MIRKMIDKNSWTGFQFFHGQTTRLDMWKIKLDFSYLHTHSESAVNIKSNTEMRFVA